MTAPALDVKALASQWERWAKASLDRAAYFERRHEEFEANLKKARAQVRAAAARLLRMDPDAAHAAQVMMHHATRSYQRTIPLIDFDNAAVLYTVARTWQACAWEIDPDLPEVQPNWD